MAVISHINWIGFLAFLDFLPCCAVAFYFAARNASKSFFGSFLEGFMLQTKALSFMLVALVFAVIGENGGGWNVDALFKSASSLPLKSCLATDEACIPTTHRRTARFLTR